MIERLQAWIRGKVRSVGRLAQQASIDRIDEVAERQRSATDLLHRHIAFVESLRQFTVASSPDLTRPPAASLVLQRSLRAMVREGAGLSPEPPDSLSIEDGLREFEFLRLNRQALKPAFDLLAGKRVLFVGQAYYYAWNLSRALRARGWQASLLNWDTNAATQIYYHGEDFRFTGAAPDEFASNLEFYLSAIYGYDIYHFSNAHGICFGYLLKNQLQSRYGAAAEIHLLKALGKKIVYTNNGCFDGVSQTAFSQWGPESVCAICRWRTEPSVCSDALNLEWGRFRNDVADFQCNLGSNKVDFNDASTVHEVPEFFCLDPALWNPAVAVPEELRLPPLGPRGVRLYHGIGHRDERTMEGGVNIKCSHIYRPLIETLRGRGFELDLLEPTGVANRDLRFLQAQADIFLDMLTFGWFGATAREGMMLGKPVIAFIRPEWLADVRAEIPEYADTLPIVPATPATVEAVLVDLLEHPDKRRAIGDRSRAFALKWHSSEAGARRFDEIYQRLLQGDRQLRGAAR